MKYTTKEQSTDFENKWFNKYVMLSKDSDMQIKDQTYFVTAALYRSLDEPDENIFAVLGEDYNPPNVASWYTIRFDKPEWIEKHFQIVSSI